MNKMNCWEFMRCGRQMGGHLAHHGVCPTATEVKLNGAHGGQLGGRSCWVVQGTKCHGETQGAFGEKYKECENCAFYRAVMREEGTKFILAPVLLGRLRFEKQAPANNSLGCGADRLPASRASSR